jgi:hypothetical protein
MIRRVHRDRPQAVTPRFEPPSRRKGPGTAASGGDVTTGPQAPARSLTELQRTAGNQAVATLVVQRHKVAHINVHPRHTHADLFDPPGTTLDHFHKAAKEQNDWFVEPTVAPDRADLHALLRRAAEPHVLAGAGDLKLAELRPLGAADWTALTAFGRAVEGSDTVKILGAAPYPLARRIALGSTLLALEAVIPPQVLRRTVSEAQFADVDAAALVDKIAKYWTTFSPHLETTYEEGAGKRAEEFEGVLRLVRGVGHDPFRPLLGKVRNLHRFSEAMLHRLIFNFSDHSRLRPVHLLLFTGHDEPGAFLQSAHLFEDLVVNSPNNVLMLEGQGALATITKQIPELAANYGQPDATGTPRIAQAMIAGHGEARLVELAGTGPADAAGNYPKENLDLNANQAKTQALIDALLTNLDPATARVVFAGCLVGSNPIPKDMAAGAMAGHIASTPSLATFTQQRAAALGLGAGFSTQAGRASLGLSGAASLHDRTGNLNIKYPTDPTAFGGAAGYVSTGHEPTGLFRAAVEVAVATGPFTAELLLRQRLAAGASSSDAWWDQCVLALVSAALAPIAPGTGISAERLNSYAHLSDTPFLGRFGTRFGISAASWVTDVNPHPDAADIYSRIVATPTMAGPTTEDERIGRFHLEQGWLALPNPARVAPLMAFLDMLPPAMTARTLQDRLDVGAIGAHSPTLFAPASPLTSGRIRLALAWLFLDPANADVQAYLNAQVVTPPTGVELAAVVRAQLGGIVEEDVLGQLGRLVAKAAAAPGEPEIDAANVQVRGTGKNRVLVVLNPYAATVLASVLNVRDLPGLHGTPFAWAKKGDVLNVVGFTHDWAGVDITSAGKGKLGFVHRAWITPP